MHMQNMDQLNAQDHHQNVTVPQATEYHSKRTHAQHRSCDSSLDKACWGQDSPAHAAGHVEMAWTDESAPAIFFDMCYPIIVARRDPSPVTGTVNQATMTNSIKRCGYLYCF